MALDVYVGPLTRYYARQWESVAQIWARKIGAQFHEIRLNAPDEAPPHPEQIRPVVVEWQGAMAEALGDRLAEPLSWDESSADYTAACPYHEGLWALRLWAAYADCPDLARPERFAVGGSDPALDRMNVKGTKSRFYLVVCEVEFWLPGSFSTYFKAEAPDGGAAWFGSVNRYVDQLEALNAATWQADQATIDSWGRETPEKDAPLEQAAKYAFCEMLECARLARGWHLPMKLDY